MTTFRVGAETGVGACVSLVYQWIKRSREAGHPLRLKALKEDLGAVQIAQTVYERRNVLHLSSTDTICTRFGLTLDTAQSCGPFAFTNSPFAFAAHMVAKLSHATTKSIPAYSGVEARAQEIANRLSSKNGYMELGISGTPGLENSYGHSFGAYCGREYVFFDPNRVLQGFGASSADFEYGVRQLLLTYYEDLLSNPYQINVVS